MKTHWLWMAVIVLGCSAPRESAPPARPAPPAASSAASQSAPAPSADASADASALAAALPAQQVIVFDRDEAPLALVKAACSERSLTIVESAGTADWGRITARDAANGQVLASWELAEGAGPQCWMLIVRASSKDLMQEFAKSLNTAR